MIDSKIWLLKCHEKDYDFNTSIYYIHIRFGCSPGLHSVKLKYVTTEYEKLQRAESTCNLLILVFKAKKRSGMIMHYFELQSNKLFKLQFSLYWRN